MQDVVRVFHIFSEPERELTRLRQVEPVELKVIPFEADASRLSSELSARVLTSVLCPGRSRE